jgi:AhpD family alkylhydroperoxidase
MEPRLNYPHIAPDGYAAMKGLEHYLNTATGLEATLQGLVRLLSSELNGCEYCIRMHTAELKHHNETPDRIASVLAWRDATVYTQKERAALAWAEAITNIQQAHAPDAVYNELKAHFTPAEMVNLTLTITNINAWNRLQIAFGEHSSRG